jgi:outer membrane protein assembly factor BamB
VIALSAEDGALRWRVRVSSEVLAPPRASGGVVVVRTVDGRLAGLDGLTGGRLWAYDRSVPILTLRGTSPPVITHDAVLAGLDSGRLVAVALRDGRALWEQQITQPRGRSELERMVDIDAEPVVANETVYVVTYQGSIAALDLFSGRGRWQREMSSNTGLGVDSRHVYVSDTLGQVWAMDRASGSAVWRQARLKGRGLTAPVAVGEHVVVGDAEGYLHWLRRDDGQFAARTRLDSAGIAAAPVVADGETVFVYGKGGTLAAVRAE